MVETNRTNHAAEPAKSDHRIQWGAEIPQSVERSHFEISRVGSSQSVRAEIRHVAVGEIHVKNGRVGHCAAFSASLAALAFALRERI